MCMAVKHKEFILFLILEIQHSKNFNYYIKLESILHNMPRARYSKPEGPSVIPETINNKLLLLMIAVAAYLQHQ